MTAETKLGSKLDYSHYVLFPDDGRRHEIIDGEHFVNPAPETYHQTLSRRIQFQLYTQIELKELGQIYDAPTDLQLSEHDIVQPDLILVLRQNQTIITPTKIKGIPDLVVEILSRSTGQYDRIRKKELYSRTRVPEYWIVDPNEHVVEQFVLDASKYRSTGRHGERIRLHVLDGIEVKLVEVW